MYFTTGVLFLNTFNKPFYIYKLLEITRLHNHTDMRTIELSKTFHQVRQLLRNTIEIVLL